MSSFLRCLLCLLVAGLSGFANTAQGQTVTYQSPDFDFVAFDPDAVSLPKKDQRQVVDALAALACNFSEDGSVDADLREKALAIALRLDPLHGPARQTHAALKAETLPAPLEFLTSRSRVATILLTSAETLEQNLANLDDQALALYLWELGLTSHPAPDFAQVSGYQTALDRFEKKNLPWKEFVTVSPGSPSEIHLRRTVSRILNEGEPPAEGVERPGPPSITAASIFSETPPTAAPTTMVEPPAPEPAPPTAVTLVRDRVTLPLLTMIGDTPAVGNFELVTRAPDETEASLLGLFGGDASSDTFEMRLQVDRESPYKIGGFKIAGDSVREDYPVWPENRLAIVSYAPISEGAPESGTLNAFIPTALGLRSLFEEPMRLRGDLLIVGAPAAPKSKEFVVSPDNILSQLEAAGGTDYRAILAPESAEPLLQETLLGAQNPMGLVRPQILSMADFADYATHLTEGGIPEATETAMSEFNEIEDLLDKGLDLRQIATNEIVQQRLEGILEKCPNHLSAKVLLAWGKADLFAPASSLNLTESLDAIDEILAPFVKQLADARDGSGVFYPNIDDDLGEAFSDLRRLGSEIDPRAKDYLRLAEDSLDPFELFLSVRDKTTSSALQKRTALSKVLADLEQARERLGEG